LLLPALAAVLLTNASEGIWTKGSFVRNAKNQSRRLRRKNREPHRLFVSAALLKSGHAREKDPGRSQNEHQQDREAARSSAQTPLGLFCISDDGRLLAARVGRLRQASVDWWFVKVEAVSATRDQ
jgi:hypothetical protein